MSAEWNELIGGRGRDGFRTLNLRASGEPGAPGRIDAELDRFRSLISSTEDFLFFEHEGVLHYPVALEFWSINNHLLHLLFELEIQSFDLLVRILNSSLAKEENHRARMRALVVKTRTPPSHCVPIPFFRVEPQYRIDFEE